MKDPVILGCSAVILALSGVIAFLLLANRGLSVEAIKYGVGQGFETWVNGAGTVYIEWITDELVITVGESQSRSTHKYKPKNYTLEADGRIRVDVKMTFGSLTADHHSFKRLDYDTMRFWFGGSKHSTLLERW